MTRSHPKGRKRRTKGVTYTCADCGHTGDKWAKCKCQRKLKP